MSNYTDLQELSFMTVKDAEKALAALRRGQKIAVFALDDEEKPSERLSDVILQILPDNDKNAEVLAPALKYLNANYNKDIKLAELANLCDISPCYFSRLFGKSTGKTLSSYILDLRLSHACRLLLTTSRSVVSIASEAGYPDCGYFYKLFRKKYNCTPLAYRNSLSVRVKNEE